MTALPGQVADILTVDADAFCERAAADAEVISEAIADGVFDNSQATLGFEYEFYGVATETYSLERLPRRLLELVGFEKELGLHNAELTTSPQPFSAYGLQAQETEMKARLEAALELADVEGMCLVSDGLWTIGPRGEDARHYLTESVERPITLPDESGRACERPIRIATNMSAAARYHAMANTESGDAAGMCLEAPNVTLASDTVMPESLITSIQPHYQVPTAVDLPEYFNYALRVAGPLLALGVNAPFFPPELYDESATPADVVADAWMDHRIPVFETMLNDPTAGKTEGKVRFPRDLTDVSEAVERVVADDTIVPMPVETGNRFDDAFPHFRRKHGTYWRWVRPVFDGPTREAANARIEFRPISSQPTVRDSVAMLAVFAGLLESLSRNDHPVRELPWVVARENFYAAMRDGLEAELTWVTSDGETTTDAGALYADLFAHAKDGLTRRGLAAEQVAQYLYPLRYRVRHELTPARWKHEIVRSEIEAGATLEDAIETMQRRYISTQRETLLEGSFADWIDSRIG